eukprot:gene5758-biopygen2332
MFREHIKEWGWKTTRDSVLKNPLCTMVCVAATNKLSDIDGLYSMKLMGVHVAWRVTTHFFLARIWVERCKTSDIDRALPRPIKFQHFTSKMYMSRKSKNLSTHGTTNPEKDLELQCTR